MEIKLPGRNMATCAYRPLRAHDLIDGVESLVSRQKEALTEPVMFLIKHLEKIVGSWSSLGIKDTANSKFDSHQK